MEATDIVRISLIDFRLRFATRNGPKESFILDFQRYSHGPARGIFTKSAKKMYILSYSGSVKKSK